MENLQAFTQVLVRIGPLEITDSAATAWLLTGGLWLIVFVLTRNLSVLPRPVQVVLEGIVLACENAVRELLPQDYPRVVPFLMALWIFLVAANLTGLAPGLHSPTRDLSVTAALAVLVFFSVHWFGIAAQGLRDYLRHYLSPSPILLPFHIISELSRTVALAVRLFGNMMSMEMVAMLMLLIAGLLLPVPVLMLHIVEALVQAYIFGMLALVYIAGGIQTRQPSPEPRAEEPSS